MGSAIEFRRDHLSQWVDAEPTARVPGWFNHGDKILELIEQHRPKVCVELGTWQGASAIPVARSIARWGGTLTCVDTWSGDLNDDGGSASGQSPIMLLTCARAMVEAGVSANVRLIPAMTADAAKAWSEPIDFLYVDADHSFAGVRADLVCWYPHVRPGGLIVGDDYEHPRYPGVRLAWDKFEEIHGLTLTRYQSTPPMQGGVQIIYGFKGRPMKIRAKANGNIVDVSDGEAEALLAAGIYERLDAPVTPKAPKAPPAKAPTKTPGESTKVAPLTTKDMPPPLTKPEKGL